jgi:hypothetical protein
MGDLDHEPVNITATTVRVYRLLHNPRSVDQVVPGAACRGISLRQRKGATTEAAAILGQTFCRYARVYLRACLFLCGEVTSGAGQ